MSDEPQIKMHAVKDGSMHGQPFKAGDTFDVEQIYVDMLQRQGLAVPVDSAEILAPPPEPEAPRKPDDNPATKPARHPVSRRS